MKIPTAILLMFISAVSATAQSHVPKKSPETSHLAFATEYIDELATAQGTREQLDQEMAQTERTPDAIGREIVYSSTRVQIELREKIHTLKRMRLDPPFDFLIPGIVAIYEDEIKIHQRTIEIGTAFIGGPKPGVDYDKLGTEMPKLRAYMEDDEQTLGKMGVAVVYALTDPRADSKHRCSHLLITKTERDKLVASINTYFGAKLDEKEPLNGVVGAILVRTGLMQDWKFSDDPWE